MWAALAVHLPDVSFPKSISHRLPSAFLVSISDEAEIFLKNYISM